jgi:hypothetical protein
MFSLEKEHSSNKTETVLSILTPEIKTVFILFDG